MTVDPAKSDCVFCDIVTGDADASVVYEGGRVLAFMDVAPVTPGHVLVVPKTHVAYLEGLDADLGVEVFQTAHRVARALRRSGLRCEGVNLFLADGKAAFQEVFHVHLHIFPRFAGDSFRVHANWRTAQRLELEAAAEKVRHGLHLVPGEFT